MSISKEIERIKGQSKSSMIMEVNIEGIGSSSNRYKVKLRNGTIITEVLGDEGFRVGESVTVAMYPGKVNRYVILGKGYKSTGAITEVWV